MSSTYRIEPLGKHHDRTAFQCGTEALDRYLKQRARQDAGKCVAAPLVLLLPPGAEVLGYYTLSAAVIDVSDLARLLACPAKDVEDISLRCSIAKHQLAALAA